ncbi:MAG TPA: ATP-binding cassette domain-containing protein [Acidimicrobiia bacterium]|nr:ATP-binding cassette domain-containing protein [Acidimicrobiia bacterium]
MSPSGAPAPVAVAAAWIGMAGAMVLAAGDYRLPVVVAAGVLAMAAVGVDVSVGSAGMLVFSAPAFMQIGAFASALVSVRSGLPAGIAPGAGIAAGLAAGLVLAAVVAVALRRVSGVGVALLTLFVFQLVRGIARQQEVLGGTIGLSGVPPFQVGTFRAETAESQAVVVAIGLAAVLAVVTRYLRSDAGRELLAVRADPVAAEACGVSAVRRRTEAFVLGSLCSTLAGSLYAHTLGFTSADALGLGVLMDLLLMVFLGGAGSLWGTVIGALAVRLVPELWAVPERLEVLARGATFLVVLAVVPGGLAGAVKAVGLRLRRQCSVSAARPDPAPLVSRWRPPPGEDGGPVLEVSGVSRAFGPVLALDGVDLALQPGELCAVVGANGAGKTTLYNVIAGLVRPDAGRVRLGGVDVTALPAHRRARLGVTRTFQEVRLFPGLTVLDHAVVGTGVANGNRTMRALWTGAGASTTGTAARTAAEDALAATGLTPLAAGSVGGLPFGWQRRVELARCLAARPVLILLDEVASGLSTAERRELLDVIRAIAGRAAILLIEHDVDFVLALESRVVVLDQGRVVFDGPASAAVGDATAAGAYWSRAGAEEQP